MQVNTTEEHRLFLISCVFANKIYRGEITHTLTFFSKIRSIFNTENKKTRNTFLSINKLITIVYRLNLGQCSVVE